MIEDAPDGAGLSDERDDEAAVAAGVAAEHVVDRRMVHTAALVGTVLAFHFGAWIWSLELTSVTRACVLVATQPIFAGLAAKALGDRVGRLLYLGTAVAILGTYWMTAAPGASEGRFLGDVLATSAAVAAAIYLAIGRGVSERVELAVYMTFLNGVAAVVLLAVAIAIGVDFGAEGVGLREWLPVLWLGLMPGFVGHGLMNWAARRTPVHVVSIAVMLEPVGAALLAFLWLGQQVGQREALGAAALLVGAGMCLVVPRQNSNGD